METVNESIRGQVPEWVWAMVRAEGIDPAVVTSIDICDGTVHVTSEYAFSLKPHMLHEAGEVPS